MSKHLRCALLGVNDNHDIIINIVIEDRADIFFDEISKSSKTLKNRKS